VNPILVGMTFMLFMFVMTELIVLGINKYSKRKTLLQTEEEE
jgi:hypothetical protein